MTTKKNFYKTLRNACANGRVKVVNTMLKGNNTVNLFQKSPDGCNCNLGDCCLYSAVRYERVDIVRILLELRGDDGEYLKPLSSFPALCANAHKKTDTLKVLLEWRSPNGDRLIPTLDDVVLANGHFETCKLLYKHMSDTIDRIRWDEQNECEFDRFWEEDELEDNEVLTLGW